MAAHVDVHHALPFVHRHLFGGDAVENAGRRDQDVQASELPSTTRSTVACTPASSTTSQVRRVALRPSACKLLGDRLHWPWPRNRHGHVGTVYRQTTGDGAAQSTATAADEGDLTAQVELLRDLLGRYNDPVDPSTSRLRCHRRRARWRR